MAKEQKCGCPEDHKHCKGGQRHQHHHMILDSKRFVICATTHCLEALCSCIGQEVAR